MEDEAGGTALRGLDRNSRAAGLEGLCGLGLVVDLESARGVVQVKDDAAAFFSDDAHGLIEDLAAVAIGREDVAGGAAGVDADEDGVGARLAIAQAGSLRIEGALVHSWAAGAEVSTDE